MFNAGLRYIKARAWVMSHHGISKQADFADILGVDYSMSTRYVKMQKFSQSILTRLARLEDYGINYRWFTDENAEMLLPGYEEEASKPDTETTKAILEALKKQGELIEDIFQLILKLVDPSKTT